MKKIGFLIVFIALIISSCKNEKPVQSVETKVEITEPDTIGLEAFWNKSVVPVLGKDIDKLKEIIHFPLEGTWRYDMGFNKEESKVSASEFFTKFDLLFNEKCIKKLKELDFESTQVYIGDGYTQLFVSNGWELPYTNKDGTKGHREGGIILKYKKIENTWKLFSINSMR